MLKNENIPELGIELQHDDHYIIVRKLFGKPLPKDNIIKYLQNTFNETVTWGYKPKESDYRETEICVVQVHQDHGDTLVYLRHRTDFVNFVLNYKDSERCRYIYIEVPEILKGMYNHTREEITLTPEEEIKYTYFKEELNKINI